MSKPNPDSSLPELPLTYTSSQQINLSQFQQEVERLHELTVWGRWLVVSLLWLTVGLASLWELRSVLELCLEDFTWAALKYGLIFNRLASIGLALCIGMTLAVLVWQSRNILFGRPKIQQQRLEKRVLQIRQQGRRHPLWRWVCRQ
jgi:hypothetical protein